MEDPTPFGLAPRELEVMKLVAEGLESKEIARQLKTSPSTINNQVQSAKAKIGISDRWDAARLLLKALNRDDDSLTSELAPLPDEPPTRSDEPRNSADADRLQPMPVLRDGEQIPLDLLPPRAEHHWRRWLFREPGEQYNDMTASETIRSIVIALFILAASASLLILSMTTWR